MNIGGGLKRFKEAHDPLLWKEPQLCPLWAIWLSARCAGNRGKTGEALPLEARLLLLCDTSPTASPQTALRTPNGRALGARAWFLPWQIADFLGQGFFEAGDRHLPEGEGNIESKVLFGSPTRHGLSPFLLAVGRWNTISIADAPNVPSKESPRRRPRSARRYLKRHACFQGLPWLPVESRLVVA